MGRVVVMVEAAWRRYHRKRDEKGLMSLPHAMITGEDPELDKLARHANSIYNMGRPSAHWPPERRLLLIPDAARTSTNG
jgi:hypothetical protein